MSDLIDRQIAISAICNACGKIDCDKMDKCEKLQLPPANNSEIPNSSDTISRQDIIQRLEYVIAHGVPNERGKHEMTAEAMLEAVKQLPPAHPAPSQVAKDIARIAENGKDMRVIAQPERIKGHWIPVGGALYQCDQCGVVSLKRKFCSECGADMREEKEK